MIVRLKTLLRDTRGAAVIQMAIALPVLVLLIYGIFQVGVMAQANAGMQHALGEGARYATLFPTPTDDQIIAKINDRKFGLGIGTFGTPTVTNGTSSDGTAYKDLAVSFTMTPDYLFFQGPAISLSKTKRVYSAGRIA